MASQRYGVFLVLLACSASPTTSDDGGVDGAADAAAVDVNTDVSQDVAIDGVVVTTGPAVTRSFDGDTGQPGAGCGGAPGCAYKDHPDMGVAANGSQVVEVTGQNVLVFDYSGAQLAKTAFSTFIGNAGLTAGAVNDPRITFDPFISRWIVVCSCSSDFVMVSGSSDATGAWKGVALGVGTGDLTMFPGWDKNGVYVAEYGGSATSYDVIALPSADVAWTTSNVSLAHEAVFTTFPYETRPAMDPNTAKLATDPAYFVARDGPPQNGTNITFDVLVDSLTWNGTTAAKGAQHVLATGFLYNTPIVSPQPSAPGLRGLESHRPLSAFVNAQHLHTVIGSGPCKTGCGSQGVDAHQLFFWFDVDTAAMTIADKAKISSASVDYLFPTLALDSSGNAAMVATATSTTSDASVVVFSHRVSDPLGQINGPITATAGSQVYSCNATDPVGWGDYAQMAQDPSDTTKLWAVAEYGASATSCQWQTRLLQLTP